jgi:hypothetical protein
VPFCGIGKPPVWSMGSGAGRDSRPRNEAPHDLDNLLDGWRLAGCQLADVEGMHRIVDSAEGPGDEIVDVGAVDSHVAALFEAERPAVDSRFDEAAGGFVAGQPKTVDWPTHGAQDRSRKINPVLSAHRVPFNQVRRAVSKRAFALKIV